MPVPLSIGVNDTLSQDWQVLAPLPFCASDIFAVNVVEAPAVSFTVLVRAQIFMTKDYD